MHNYLMAELLKLKRRKLFIALLAVSCLILLLIIQSAQVPDISLRSLFYNSTFLTVFIHPAIISVIAIMIFSKDYETGMMRHMLIVPVSILKIFVAKILIITLISIVLAVLTSLQLIIVSMAAQVQGITIPVVTTIALLYILFSILIILGILPIIAIVAACKHNIVIPIFSTFLYLGIMAVPSTGLFQKNTIIDIVLTYFYPVSSAFSIFNEIMDSASMGRIIFKHVNIVVASLSLLAFSIFFAYISIRLFKKKES